jgi:hypothetical protein
MDYPRSREWNGVWSDHGLRSLIGSQTWWTPLRPTVQWSLQVWQTNGVKVSTPITRSFSS